jgi:HJR/Mrr/RecB family endonuclease
VLREPESLYRLPPRKFEEFIAAILEDLGWEINLTPATSDGGRDIIAVVPSEIGNLLCLVEVKRYRQDRKVGVELVRQLYGTVTHEEASYGLLVTSSSFSKEAMRFEQVHRYRIGLKDFGHVLEWTRRFCGESS